MPQLHCGDSWERFELDTARGKFTLATPVCFEGTFPRVCRKLVMNGEKKADVLVNLSNDGWFVWKYSKGNYRRSSEHFLHLIQYCFRAVELRVPVVRAVNTGVSAYIDSSGRIVDAVDPRGNYMVSTEMLLDKDTPQRVLVDTRESLYSKTGDIFAMAVSCLAVALTAWMIFTKKKEQE